MNYFFTHIFAPYAVTTSSLAGIERALVLESWQTAANIAASNGIHVEFLGCPLETDIEATPHFARTSSPIKHYAIDPFQRKFPTIGGIFDKGVNEGVGDYLVYTNMDIGVYPDFYVHSYNLLINAEKSRKEKLEMNLNASYTALEYTRVQSMKLKSDMKPPTLKEVLEYPDVGRHPGHDCFILPRKMVPLSMRSGGLVVGMPPWGTMYHLGIQKDPHVDLLFLQGTTSQRYTFHTGVDGTGESWMDNQDFRLQQYSEAFRLFGAESIGRAWGAKGRNSPFFYMCNGTVMRFPMCSFCESFYPNSLYSEFSKRTCKGLTTDRSFFAHLPIPEHTIHSDNLPSMVDSKVKGKESTRIKNTYSHGDGQLAKTLLGRQLPCKVKCIQEKALCKKVSTKAWIPTGSRPPHSNNDDISHLKNNEEIVNNDKIQGGLHSSPPMIWSYLESDWLRSMFENTFGYKTGSIIMTSTKNIQDDQTSVPLVVEPVKNGEQKKKKNVKEVVDLDLRHGCHKSAMGIFTESSLTSISSLTNFDSQTTNEKALLQQQQPPLNLISPSCLRWKKFQHVVAIIRNPYDTIWQQYHIKWLLKKDPTFFRSSIFSDSISNKLALNFIGDGDSIEEFKTFAIMNANIWNKVHIDLLKYKKIQNKKVNQQEKLFILKYENLIDNNNGMGDNDMLKLSQFLGLNKPSTNRLHCSYVSSKTALLKSLNPLQKASSMDSLYEGLITCQMWSIFNQTATLLGYSNPLNQMACFHMKNVKLSNSITETSVNMLNNLVQDDGNVDLVVKCSWLRWLMSDQSELLQDWMTHCASAQSTGI